MSNSARSTNLYVELGRDKLAVLVAAASKDCLTHDTRKTHRYLATVMPLSASCLASFSYSDSIAWPNEQRQRAEAGQRRWRDSKDTTARTRRRQQGQRMISERAQPATPRSRKFAERSARKKHLLIVEILNRRVLNP